MRKVNRVASAILGLAMCVFGVLLAIEVTVVAIGDRPWLLPLDDWYRFLTTTTVESSWIRFVSVAVGVVGLAILLSELMPFSPERVRLDGAARATPTQWRIARRTLEYSAARAAVGVGGVGSARARVRGRERQWRVDIHAIGDPDRGDDVRRAVARDLDRLGASPGVPVKVALVRERPTA